MTRLAHGGPSSPKVTQGSIGGLIYADHGSGAPEDMAIYWMANTNVIVAHRGYGLIPQMVWQPKK